MPQILGGTVAGILRRGRDHAGATGLVQALHRGCLGRLLATVGLDGWIGGSGERPSAGDRSCLALARALLSTADLILVDELTAHLAGAVAARARPARRPGGAVSCS